MSYKLKVVADGANLFYPMDETSGTVLTNVSYQTLNGTYTSAVFSRPPIMHRSFRSIGLTSGSYSIGLNNILRSGYESNAFTIEFWLRANVTPTATTGVFASGSQGVFITPNTIEFRTSYSSGTKTVKYYVPNWNQNYHIAFAYTREAILLYVNGELVDSADTFGETFNSTPTSWGNTGAANIDIEGIAIFLPSISEQVIATHYQVGADYIPLEIIFGLDDGQTFLMSDNLATIDLKETWPQNGDWVGEFTDVVNDNGVLSTGYTADGVITNGTWQYAIPLDAFGTVDGSRIDWDGYGVTFDVSHDAGDTWLPCTNHQLIPGVTPGYDGTGKAIVIRATLADSLNTVDLPRLYSATFTLYESRSQKGWDSTRFATVYGDVDLQAGMGHPAHRSGLHGATLRSGSIVLEADVDNAMPVYTVECWIKRNSATAGQILDLRATGQTGRGNLSWSGSAITSAGWLRTYINGANVAPSASNMPQGAWVHFIGVLSATTTDPIYFNRVYNGTSYGSNSIAYPTIYPGQLTDTQAGNRYSMFAGGFRLRVDDAVQVSIDEDPANPPLLYADAWSITGAG